MSQSNQTAIQLDENGCPVDKVFIHIEESSDGVSMAVGGNATRAMDYLMQCAESIMAQQVGKETVEKMMSTFDAIFTESLREEQGGA